MVVTVTAKWCKNANEAGDVLSDWHCATNFIFGYVTEHTGKVEVTGLFLVRDGQVERDQRNVLRWMDRNGSEGEGNALREL